MWDVCVLMGITHCRGGVGTSVDNRNLCDRIQSTGREIRF